MKSIGELQAGSSPEQVLNRLRGLSDDPADSEQETGWVDPNVLQIPKIFFRYYMRGLTKGELLCLLYLFWKTYGFGKGKKGDFVPLSQIQEGTVLKSGERKDWGTGLSREGALTALSSLEKMGFIEVVRGQKRKESDNRPMNHYRIKLKKEEEEWMFKSKK